MVLRKTRVAVVGGGPAGMMAVHWLKKEGLEPICFEKTPYFGGTWNYRDEDMEGVGSVMWTTVINHSKEMGSPSSDPPKKEYPNYMKHFELLEMFKELAYKYDVVKHILYNYEVMKVSKAEDYEASGRWIVKVKNNATGEITEDIYDGVLVCVGHITYPKIPKFPRMEEYKGKILHTHSLKKVEEFKNQNVVVVGVGCSGLDAAVEASNVAKQVYLSTRSGTWIFPRVGPDGVPFDFAILRRAIFFFQERIPISFTSYILENFFLNQNFNHSLYNLKPKYRALCKDPSVNDFIPGKLITGSVVVKKNIKHFTEKGVVFDGEEEVTEADTVIMATGYTWKFPFLDEGILTTEENGRINLYKCVYPAHLPHPTLAIIGFLLPFGPGFPLGEMQCRWASHLLAGKGSLPSTEVMMAEVEQRHEQNSRRYSPSDKMSVRVDFISYIDNIAEETGVKPNFLRMAFKDPKLFVACIFGPCLPYQFRLEGPHSWPGAREAILTARDRMKRPLLGGERSQTHFNREGYFRKYVFALLITSLFLLFIDSDKKYHLVALFGLLLPHILRLKSLVHRFLFFVLVLPFFITWPGFIKDYLVTLLVPVALCLLSCIS